MAKKIVISELDFDTDGAVQAQANLLKEITKVKEAQKDLRKETQNLSDANDQQRKSYVENEQQLKKLNAEYRQNQKVIDESTTAIDGLNEAMDKEIKTKRDAIKNNKELREIQNSVNATTEEGQALIAKLSKKIDENTEFIKENSDSFVKQKMNIGNYTESVVSAANQVNILGVGMGDLGTGLMGVGKGAGSGSKGLQVMRTAATALVAVPIIALFAGLATMLTKTQEGMDIVNKLTLQLQGAFGVIIERASFLGKAVVKLFQGDFKGAVETAGKAFESGFTDKIKEAVEDGGAVAELQKANRELANQSIVTIAELEKQAEELNQTADDATISLAKQQKAAEKAAKVEAKIADERIKQAKRDLKQFTDTAKVKGRLNAEDKKTIAELKAAVKDAEKEKTAAVMRNATRVRQIDQDTFEQRLDYLIDGFDNFKATNERIIASESTTAEERVRLLRATQEEFERNTAQQIALFEEQAGKKIDLNKLVQISDQETLYNEIAMLELSEIENQRLLEVVRENRTFEQDMIELTTETMRKNFEDRIEMEELYLDNSQKARHIKLKEELDDMFAHGESLKNIARAESEGLAEIERDRVNQEFEIRKQEIWNAEVTTEEKTEMLKGAALDRKEALNNIERQQAMEELEIRRDGNAAIAEEVAHYVGLVGDILNEANNTRLEKDLAAFDDQISSTEAHYDQLIEAAGGNAEEIARLEEEKRLAVERIQAEAEAAEIRAQQRALAINMLVTAANVIAATFRAFAVGGLPAAIATAAAGAVGLGIMAAQIIKLGGQVPDIPDMPFSDGQGAAWGSDDTSYQDQFDNSSDSQNQEDANDPGRWSGGGGGSWGGGNFRGTPFLEGKGNATSDDILFLGSRGEAVIPTARNLQYLGLSKAMIDGNVGEWVLSNTHLLGGNFNDANIVKGLTNVKNAVRSNRPIIKTEEISLRDKMNREAYIRGKYGNVY